MKRAAKYVLPLAAVVATGLEEAADAGDIFLKIEPIQGESLDQDHSGEIDVLAWSWGVSKPVPDGGGGGGSGPPSFTDIKVIKSFDTASPALLAGVATGVHFDDAILSINRQTGKGPVEYLNITLTDVILTKIANGGKDGEPGVSETVTLNFAKVEINYTQLDSEGNPVGGETKTCWDIPTNNGC